jgi:WD40 repeat protein
MTTSQARVTAADAGTPDAFVSYAHEDATAVLAVVEAARSRGRRMWVDGDDIPAGAPWRTELGTALEAATAVLICLSPDWLESAECRQEYDRAVELGKRLIPMVVRRVEQTRGPVGDLQWIDATDGADRERVATEIIAAVEADHDRALEHKYWLGRALRWDSRARDRSLLLRGKDLASAENWLARGGVEPTPIPLQTALVTASRQAERRRLRTTAVVSLLTVALLATLTIVALVQRSEAVNQRNQAQSRALAAAAQAQLDIDPERSLLLADAAYSTAPTSQAVSALRSSLLRSRVRVAVAAHPAPVSGVAWSADGRTVVTAGRDGGLAAWDAASGESKGRLAVGPDAVQQLVAARQAPVGVATTESGKAVLWTVDPESGALGQRAVLADSGINDVAISDDGQVVAGAREAGPVGIWGARGQEGAAVEWDTDGARSVALSASGTTLLIGTTAGALAGPLRSGRPVLVSSYPGSTVQLSVDGSVALAAADTGEATLRRLDEGQQVDLPTAFEAALDPTGERALVGQVDGQVALVSPGAQPDWLLGRGTPAVSLGFSSDGRLVAAAKLDGTITVWQAAGATPLTELRGSSASTLRIAFSPDGRQLASGDGDGTVRVWSLPEQPLQLPLTAGMPSVVATSAAFSPDGETVLTADRGGLARIWDSHNGTEKPANDQCTVLPLGPHCLAAAALSAHYSPLTRAVYSPDGRLVATSSDRGRIVVMDQATTEAFGRSPDIDGRVSDIAFSHDSRQLATADDGGAVRIIEATTGRVLTRLGVEESDVWAVTFAPGSGAVLAADSDGLIRRWDLTPDPAPRILLDAGDAVFDLAVEPSGRLAAAATGSGLVVLDPNDGHRVRSLGGHSGFVTAAAFSPDGRLLFSGGKDGTVRAWDVATGDEVAVLRVPGGDVTGLDVDRTGQRIAVSSGDGNAYVFDCEICAAPDALVDLAHNHTTRELTADERSTFGLP